MFKRRRGNGTSGDDAMVEAGARSQDGRSAAGAAEEAASSLRRLGVLLRPHTGVVVAVLVMLLGLTAVNMAVPYLLRVLVQRVLIGGDLTWLWLVMGGYIGVYAGRNILYFNSKFRTVQTGEHVAFALRKRLFERMQQKSLGYYKRQNPGKISGRVMNDSFVVQSFIQDQLPTLLQSGLLFVGLIGATYAMHWPLALAATMVLPLHLMAFRYFRRPIKEASQVAQEQMSVVHGNLIEKFLGAEVVKGFTAEGRENEAFEAAIDSSRSSQLRSQKYHVFQKVVADLLVGVGTIALIGFGAWQVTSERMTPGAFMQFFWYIGMLYPTVLELMSGLAKFTKTAAGIDRVFELLEESDGDTAATVGVKPAIEGAVAFEGVRFAYDAGPEILKGIDLSVRPGEVCAVVGPSGAGKSTLVNLVPRFHDPTAGRVLIDGRPVDEFDLPHLRGAIGIAFQDCFLFNSSVLENIRYAMPEATAGQIEQAARHAGAHEFIEKLPRGYHTAIGEGGVSLSRGEAQRITLTRAMLKDPKVLILDEATASIDVETQARIVPAILRFMRGKTTLMVTHNPDLLIHADSVAQIDRGRIVYHGPPEGLGSQLGRRAWHRLAGAGDGESEGEGRVEVEIEARRGGEPGPLRGRATAWLAAAMVGLGALCGGWGGSVAWAQGEAAAERQAKEKEPAAERDRERGEAAGGAGDAGAAGGSGPRGKLLAMPGLSDLEIREIVELTAARLETELGYREAGKDVAEAVTDPPRDVRSIRTLARSTGSGLRIVQLGYRLFQSQPPHLYLHGQTITERGSGSNDELSKAVELVEGAKASLAAQDESLTVEDLAKRKIGLSYIDAGRAIKLLKTFGYTVVTAGGAVDPKELPSVMSMPATKNHELVKGPSESFPLTDADPVSELLVIYHPSRPEQFSNVLDKVRRIIDVPARQIMIEAMVLEISEDGLKRLGVEWDLEAPQGNLEDIVTGRLPSFATAGNEEPTLEVDLKNIFGAFSAKIQALVRNGQAEVLSRPSVLTLDSRMANISVEERIPVVTSVSESRNQQVLVDFKEKVAGITLNVRPRVAADGKEISMQVVATVSARVPNADVVVRNGDGDEVARSPTISAREVKTYTRIANNTPFIIGGLISRDDTIQNDKVPLLGDIPIVGPAVFTNQRVDRERREVIIVITPYLLPENNVVARNMPKDEDAFDSFGNKLFRDAYRIRAEDVFDLAFIVDNPRLRGAKRAANRVVRRNFELGNRYPFRRFVGDRVPGERILVYRQMYEVIKRLDLDEKVNPERMIFFKPEPGSPSGFDVTFLHRYLQKIKPDDRARKLDPDNPEDWFAGLDGEALALVYTMVRDEALQNVLSQPVPEIRILDCPDGKAYERLLWDLNQPDAMGRPRFTILLRDADDLQRIRRAVLLKRVVHLNANRKALTLANFSVGRQLLMPAVKENKVYVVDEQTAKYFFYTELYYSAVQQELSRDLNALNEALDRPDVRKHLDVRGGGGGDVGPPGGELAPDRMFQNGDPDAMQ